MDFETKSTLKSLYADLKQYVEKRIELKTLELQQKGAVLTAAVVSNSLGIALIMVGFLFLLIASAIGLGYLFDNMMLGFGSLALLLMLLGFYFYKTKKNVLQSKLQLQINLFIDSVLNAPDLNQKTMGEERMQEERDKINASGNGIPDSEKN